jgi:hypothetical protein
MKYILSTFICIYVGIKICRIKLSSLVVICMANERNTFLSDFHEACGLSATNKERQTLCKWFVASLSIIMHASNQNRPTAFLRFVCFHVGSSKNSSLDMPSSSCSKKHKYSRTFLIFTHTFSCNCPPIAHIRHSSQN